MNALRADWRALGYSDNRGRDRTIVLCADCKAPLAVLTQPAPGSRLVPMFFDTIANVGLKHRPQHPAWSEPRVNLVAERDLPSEASIVNLLGQRWREVLKGLVR